MKKIMSIFGAIIFASFIFTGCGGSKSESDKTKVDSTKTEVKVEKPKSDSKAAIAIISEKYYIPVNESKSDLMFTINQNLNLELVNYKGSFAGKYIDGKVQFDDKNTTLIDFTVKGENVILKNQNDVEVEFKEAKDEDIIIGNWFNGNKFVSWPISFDKNGKYSIPKDYIFSGSGTYSYKGNKKFTVNNWPSIRKSLELTLNSPQKLTIFSGSENWVCSRTKKSKIESLNSIFN